MKLTNARVGWNDLGVRPDAPEVRFMEKTL